MILLLILGRSIGIRKDHEQEQDSRLHPAFCLGLFERRSGAEQTREILVHGGRSLRARKISRRIEPRENGMGDLAARHALFAVTGGDIARPVAHVIETKFFFHAEVDHGMAVLGAAYFWRPENFHEIAGLRFGEIIEILSEVHLVEEPSCSRPVGVPSAPDAFAIALTADYEAFARGVIEMEKTPRAQGLDRFHENKISRARAVAR